MTDNNKQEIEKYKGKSSVPQADCPERMTQKIILFCSKSHTILITIRLCLSILATYMIYDSQYAKGWCKGKMYRAIKAFYHLRNQRSFAWPHEGCLSIQHSINN